MYIEDKTLVIPEPKSIYFDLSKYVDKNLKYEIDFVMKRNELLAEHTIKNEISELLSKYQRGKPMTQTNLFLTCHKD